MNLIRFNQHPIQFLNEMMEDFDRNFNLRQSEAHMMRPAVNIRETEQSFMLELAAPGLQKEDFKVNLDNNVLTLSAEVNHEEETKNERFTRREFSYGQFRRSFSLPKTINLEEIKADYSNGILTVTLPKREDAKVAINREIAIA